MLETQMLSKISIEEFSAQLSSTGRWVVALLLEGYSDKEMAEVLSTSRYIVRRERMHIRWLALNHFQVDQIPENIFTPKFKEVFKIISDNGTYEQVAEHLSISHRDAKRYVADMNYILSPPQKPNP